MLSTEDSQSIHKIILIGDAGVGKTSIRKRYLGEGFNQNYMATIGVDFSYTSYKDTKLSIWDLAGEPNYNNVRKQFYRGASGALFVFDITRIKTLNNFPNWIKEVNTQFEYQIPIIVVGNKEDLRDSYDNVIDRETVKNKTQDWRKELKIDLPIFYSSAKTGLNITKLFPRLLELIQNSFSKI